MRSPQFSFTGGEVVPEMQARVGLTKRQAGLKLAENVLIQPGGPIEKSPGTKFVLPPYAGASSALIPMVFSDSASYVVEITPSYLCFYSLGAAVLHPTALSFTSLTFGATTSAVFGAPTADPNIVYITTPSNPAHPLHNKFWQYNHAAGKLRTVFGDEVDSSGWPAHTWNAGAGDRVYQRLLLFVGTGYFTGDLRQVRYTLQSNLLTLAHPEWGRTERVAYTASATPAFSTYHVLFRTSVQPYASVTIGATGGGTPVAVDYKVCPLSLDGLEEAVDAGSTGTNVDFSVGGTVTITVPATAPTINDNQSTGTAIAASANIYKARGGVFGFIGQVGPGGTFTDDNIVPDMTRTSPFVPQRPGNNTSVTGDFGAAGIAFWNQRQWHGGLRDVTTQTFPLALVGTRPGTSKVVTRRVVTVDDDAIYTTLLTKIGTSIRHLVALDELIAFTASSIIRVGNGQEAATPGIGARTIATVGATHVPPVETPGSVLFVGQADNHIWHLKYTNEGGGYRAEDISLFASHLFDGYTISRIAYTRGRIPMVWAVRSDGVLLACTYIPEQEVLAWFRAKTDGIINDIVAIPENGIDTLYLTVGRTLNGETRYVVERIELTKWFDREDAYLVDCGLTYDGAEVSTVEGLWHLEGEDVAVVADGAVYDKTVSGGEVTIDAPASVVHVGLRYRSRVQTLPLAMEGAQAAGMTSVQLGSHAWLNLLDSGAVRYGADFDNMSDIATRTLESFGSAPDLATGVFEVPVSDEWDYETSLCVESNEPLPMTLRSVAVEIVSEEGKQ